MTGLLNRLIDFQATPDGGDGGGAAPPERPDWLLEKFQSPDEQARAYGEAEKRMAQLQTQLDQERQQFAQTIQQVQETVTPPEAPWNPNQDPVLMSYEKAVNEGDARAMLAIQLDLQRKITQQAVEEAMKPIGTQLQSGNNADREVAITLATERVKGSRRSDGQLEYEDWEQLAPKIGQVLQTRPHMIPAGASVEAFETTLREVADMVLGQEYREALSKQQAERAAKVSAQGLTGTSSRQLSPEEEQAEWEKIKGIQLGGYTGVIRG